MVYDIADRLVASQDGNQRQKGQWTVNRYDKFNRLLYSFIATNTQSVINTVLKNNTVSEVWNGNASTGGYTIMGNTTGSLTIKALLTVNYYDTYAHLKLLDATTKG
jgi:hypothetical protein